MLRFTDLPSDLLSLVLEHLSRREYHALAHTCHALNIPATSHLYRDIKLTATKSRSCARKLALLLRTLLERPRLAPRVTTFALFGTQKCWEKYDPWPENNERKTTVKLWVFDRSKQTQSLLTPAMFHHFMDDDMQMSQEELCRRSKDALATLVMTRLTNLHILDLGDGFLRHSIILPQILKRTDYLFPDLERVVLGDRQRDRDSSVSYTDLSLIRPVFYSSTIKHFECNMAQPWKFCWSETTAPWNTHLTTLRLFRTNIERSTLRQLLSATPYLKSFHYEQEIFFNEFTPRAPSLAPYLELEGLNSALSCVRHSLEECQLVLRLAPGSISASQFASSGIKFPAIEGTLSVLKDMPRLKRVEVPMVMFVGWFSRTSVKIEELLPANITELTLRDDFVPYCYWSRPSSRERRIARIGRYIGDRETHAPKLSVLKVRLTSGKECLRDAVQEMRLCTDQKGVQTTLIHGTKSETYCWRFEKAKGVASRPALGERVDSVLREDNGIRPEFEFFTKLSRLGR
ncbi:Nn.00g076380.m01.CDS01 [Neocucurbitaria sp. VM-36]